MDVAGNALAVRQIAVVGAGLMGHGIALDFAAHGYAVRLHDRTDEQLRAAVRNVEGSLELLVHAGLLSYPEAANARANVEFTIDLRHAAGEADVVIEAVYEDLPLKQQVFRDLDAVCPQHAILASNSSSFMPSLLAAATERPDRVLVAHYFNPPFLVPLVEIVPGQGTSDETVTSMHALLTGIGKRPVVVRKEVPGFVGNRLQAALMREAVAIVEQGIASPEEVDAIVRFGFGRRLAAAGPFEVFDAAGWDVAAAVAEQLFPEIASSPEVPASIKERVARGELGIKSGQGFHTWTPESAAALRSRIGRALIEIARWPEAEVGEPGRPTG